MPTPLDTLCPRHPLPAPADSNSSVSTVESFDIHLDFLYNIHYIYVYNEAGVASTGMYKHVPEGGGGGGW